MSVKTEVWTHLLSRIDQWVTRAEIELIAGKSTHSVIRQIRTESFSLGYQIKSRPTPVKGQDEYMLTTIAGRVSPIPFNCTKCGQMPADESLQPTTDIQDRWRFGHCVVCDKTSIFARRPDTRTAQERADEAVEVVEAAADPSWMDEALDALRLICQKRGAGAMFTTDAVWYVLDKRGIEVPREPRAMGPVIRKAVSEGLIEDTGTTHKSVIPRGHARHVSVWRVL